MNVLPLGASALAERLVDSLRSEARRVGIDEMPAGLRLDAAEFVAVRDPADPRPAWQGIWRNGTERCGFISLNADGSGFAEFDICRPHPTRPAAFLEALTAWGREDSVRSEARLLDMPEESA
jgi:hypothetical protein